MLGSVVQPIDVKCPSCGNSFTAQVYLLVDGTDSDAKAMVLSGAINMAQCPHCGASGVLHVPFAYHDGEKELFLIYAPNDMPLQRKDREAFIGEITRLIMEKLPPEKRKGYLLRPKEFFSLENMTREILHADGLTDEDIARERKAAKLYNDLLNAAGDDARIKEVVEENVDLVDTEFVLLFVGMAEDFGSKLKELGQEEKAEAINGVVEWLLANTEGGREVSLFREQVEKAMKAESPEELFDALLGVPESLWYEAAAAIGSTLQESFFTLLAEEIVRREKDDPKKAEKLRRLMDVYRKYYSGLVEKVREDYSRAQKLLDRLLEADDLESEMTQHMGELLDPMFYAAWETAYQVASESGNAEVIEKLENIQKAITDSVVGDSPEKALLYSLMLAKTQEEAQRILRERKDAITPKFFETLDDFIALSDEDGKRFFSNIKAMAILAS